MPLLDHFRPPLQPHHHWESFHSNWATRIADELSELLPPGFIAEEHTYAGNRTEIDVAAFEESDLISSSSNGVALAEPKLYAPPAATMTIPAVFPDSFGVRVYQKTGGLTLVGVIELVSPANKDRPEERKAFAVKMAGYLHQGVSAIVVDAVTSRRVNLHNEIVGYFTDQPDAMMPAEASLYAAAYRPVLRDERTEIDLWIETLTIGESLPTLPLRLTGELFVPINLESTYREACRRRKIG